MVVTGDGRRGLAIAAGAALALAGALAWRAILQLGPIDDAFISLRVAANWAHGLGPVFNPGDRVEGTTSPLWTALLALGIRLGVPPIQWMLGLGLASISLAGAVCAAAAFEVGGLAAALAASLLLAALPGFPGWATCGLETPLAGALLLLAAHAATRAENARQGAIAGVVATLAALARPEAMAVVPLLAWSTRGRRAGLSLIACAAVLLGAMFLARHAYYGEWLPNTYYAKSAGGGLELRWRGAVYVGRFLLLNLPLVAVACFGARDRTTACWLAITAGFLAAVCWEGGDHFPLGRLALPAIPLLAALAGAALARRSALVTAIAAPAVVLLTLPLLLRVSDEGAKLRHEANYARQWQAIGEALREPDAPTGTVAVVTIGAIGYFSGRPILDLAGLVDRHLARAPRREGGASGHDHVDIDYVLGRAPDVVIALPALLRAPLSDAGEAHYLAAWRAFGGSAELLIEDPRFRQLYEPRDLVSRGWHLRVWVRRAA